ncbi:tRNA pseudouridine(38-40) synthase TruA [soil metagenome]
MQGALEDALARLCGGPVTTVCAGRTDTGVHATAQVVHADVPPGARLLADPDRARRALDRLCGPRVAVRRVRAVGPTFDARFSATRRRYAYRLCDAEAMNPLWRHDTWHVGPPRLDTAAMQAGARHLLGEHDFSSFCRARDAGHLLRRVDVVRARRVSAALVVLRVEGPAFCHQMVRSVTACLVAVGRGRRGEAWVAEVLAARDRGVVGQIAPPHGLTLVGVDYR